MSPHNDNENDNHNDNNDNNDNDNKHNSGSDMVGLGTTIILRTPTIKLYSLSYFFSWSQYACLIANKMISEGDPKGGKSCVMPSQVPQPTLPKSVGEPDYEIHLASREKLTCQPSMFILSKAVKAAW